MRILPTSLAILAASLVTCHDDPFGPLFNACVDQMATARTTYGVPTAEHRVTMSDGRRGIIWDVTRRSEEHTSELQSHSDLVCRLLLEKKKKKIKVEECHIRHRTATYTNHARTR